MKFCQKATSFFIKSFYQDFKNSAMKVSILSLILVTCIIKIIKAVDDSPILASSRFKSVKCTSHDQSLFTFHACRIQVYSWNESALILNYTSKIPLKGDKVHFQSTFILF